MRPIVASSGGGLLPHLHHAGGETVILPVHSKNPFVIRQNIKALVKIIESEKVDIIHARSRAPAWAAYYAAKHAGIHFMTTFHGIYGTTNIFKKYYSSIMARGERIIAISNFVCEHVLKTYHVPESRIRTIPRGVDFSIFDEAIVTPERLMRLTKEWRLADSPVPIIFCPGRISRIKGQHILIKALAGIRDMSFLCVIAGKDDGHEKYRMQLEKLIIDSGLEGKVRLTGSTNAMNEAYTLSSIVVVPSVQAEAFGRVAVEAQAVGRTVIATDHGGARETILDGQTGYLVPPNNVKLLGEAIARALHRDPALIHAMGQEAKKHVRAHFSIERMKADTIAVYREILDGGK